MLCIGCPPPSSVPPFPICTGWDVRPFTKSNPLPLSQRDLGRPMNQVAYFEFLRYNPLPIQVQDDILSGIPDPTNLVKIQTFAFFTLPVRTPGDFGHAAYEIGFNSPEDCLFYLSAQTCNILNDLVAILKRDAQDPLSLIWATTYREVDGKWNPIGVQYTAKA